MENWISAIASIASAIAAFASIIVAVMVARTQSKQEKQAQKIALFDKRYEIYKESLQILSLAKFALDASNSDKMPAHLVIADIVLAEYGLMKDERFLPKHVMLQEVIKIAPKEQSDKADRDLFYLDSKANNMLLQLREKTLNTIQPSKFCFDEKVLKDLTPCIEAFFDYIAIFKDGSAQENKRDATVLRELILKIDSEKTIERMEEYLSIAKEN